MSERVELIASDAWMDGRRIAHIEAFEPAAALGDDQREAYARRFVTLFVDDGTRRRGGVGVVVRAENAYGEEFALKTLALPRRDELEGEQEYGARVDGLKRAFRQEYECHRDLSGLKGMPRLYGWGMVDGACAIVMEWVRGQTLAQAALELAVDEDGRLSPLVASRIGRDLFELLARMDAVGEGFAHRDVSPANVMVRTSRRSVAEQADEGVFDLCLVDFGSAAPVAPQGASFTRAGGVARGATADYAPPEMLTDDIPNAEDLRKSPAIDVYAAGSVLYELACGRPPFSLTDEAAGGMSPYRAKTEQSPARPMLAHAAAEDIEAVLMREPETAVAVAHGMADVPARPDADDVKDALSFVDEQLAGLMSACLAVSQGERPSAFDMHGALAAFSRNYAENVALSLRGEPLIPCSIDGMPRGSADSALGMRRVVRAAGKAASAAVWAVVVLSAGLLADGTQASVALGSVSWQGALPGWAVSAALAFPGAAGLLVRWSGVETPAGFVRGSAALAAAAAVVAFAAGAVDAGSAAVNKALFAAAFASAAAGWCPLVMDYALAVALPARREAKRAGLPEAGVAAGLPDGGARAGGAAGLDEGADADGEAKRLDAASEGESEKGARDGE